VEASDLLEVNMITKRRGYPATATHSSGVSFSLSASKTNVRDTYLDAAINRPVNPTYSSLVVGLLKLLKPWRFVNGGLPVQSTWNSAAVDFESNKIKISKNPENFCTSRASTLYPCNNRQIRSSCNTPSSQLLSKMQSLGSSLLSKIVIRRKSPTDAGPTH